MPLQNRVTPAGALIATSARGTLMGNRGILHNADGRIVRHSRNIAWLICLLEFKNRRRAVLSPGTYTELFFLDEAVALAAGHRPCGECRRSRLRAYTEAVGAEGVRTPDLDRQLNRSRRAPPEFVSIAALPDGAFVRLGDDDFRLVWAQALHRWTPSGYVDRAPISDIEAAEVLTPGLTVAALRGGYRPVVHASAC